MNPTAMARLCNPLRRCPSGSSDPLVGGDRSGKVPAVARCSAPAVRRKSTAQPALREIDLGSSGNCRSNRGQQGGGAVHKLVTPSWGWELPHPLEFATRITLQSRAAADAALITKTIITARVTPYGRFQALAPSEASQHERRYRVEAICCIARVRKWHKADEDRGSDNVRFRGQGRRRPRAGRFGIQPVLVECNCVPIYRAPNGFSPAFVIALAASAEDRKRSSATAESVCCELFGNAPTKKVGG